MSATFLAFGLTGNLMKQKGIPALFALHKQGMLPSRFEIIGLSRKMWRNEDLYLYIEEVLKDSGGAPEEIAFFARQCSLVRGDADASESYAALRSAVGVPENLFIYLCIAPEFYRRAIEELGAQNFFGSNTRILIEKPFGTSGADAESLDTLLLQHLPEERIFRIDHYLAKEAASELAALNKRDIASITVSLLETAGVEERAALYDGIGALRDVGQNHLLEMLALAVGGAGDRAGALASLAPLTPEGVRSATVRGQYTGYAELPGVARKSHTETYFKIRTSMRTTLGDSVNVTLEAGKRMGSDKKEVSFTYTGGSSRSVSLASKRNEYTSLFANAFAGERTLFVSPEEVRALWKFADPILQEWQKDVPPLLPYEPGKGAAPGL